MPKKNRKRNSGWAKTKTYPHERHPATYRRKGKSRDDIEYITFTHSSEVDLEKETVQTVPLADNISPAERSKNKAENKKFGENRSYAYPKVYVGKRSALHSESEEFEPVEFDKKRIDKMFEVFPRENIPVTGGKGRYKKNKNKKKKPDN